MVRGRPTFSQNGSPRPPKKRNELSIYNFTTLPSSSLNCHYSSLQSFPMPSSPLIAASFKVSYNSLLPLSNSLVTSSRNSSSSTINSSFISNPWNCGWFSFKVRFFASNLHLPTHLFLFILVDSSCYDIEFP